MKKMVVANTDEFARNMPSARAIAIWLDDHTTAYEDACAYFGVHPADDISIYVDAPELIAWIADHDTLAEDFGNRFGTGWFDLV